MSDLTLTIERLTFGADAVAHLDGQVVFVPFAAPGDEVRAHVVARQPRFLRAAIDDVVRPGPSRVAPRCAWFGVCGGWLWDQGDASMQREAKRTAVEDVLTRVGRIPNPEVRPTIAPDATFGYRGRITLDTARGRMGFHGVDPKRIVEIEGCDIAAPTIATSIPPVRQWAMGLPEPPDRVTIVEAAAGIVVIAHLRDRPSPEAIRQAEALLSDVPSVVGVVLQHPRGRRAIGQVHHTVEIEPGLTLEAPADTFTQVHHDANRLLVAAVVEAVAPTPQMRVLDLYSGIGNFALPLARRGAHVHGCERDEAAVVAARANAERLGLSNVRFTIDAADAVVRADDSAVDVVVLDPPRQGAGPVMPVLAQRHARRIVYVSCDPATLARDARVLVDAGYRLAWAQPLDLFPQTFHVEVVAVFDHPEI